MVVYYGMTTQMHKQVTVIDPVVWPIEDRNAGVLAEFRNLWLENEFGNDFYYYACDVHDLCSGEYEYLDMPLTKAYCEANGITGTILLHWWW